MAHPADSITIHRSMERIVANLQDALQRKSFGADDREKITLWIDFLSHLGERDAAGIAAMLSRAAQGRFWGGLVARQAPQRWSRDDFDRAIRWWIESDWQVWALDFELERLFTGPGQIAMDGWLQVTAPSDALAYLGARDGGNGPATVSIRALFFAEFSGQALAKIDGYFDIGGIASPTGAAPLG